MNLKQLFKGRFGNFYLYKIWAFTVLFGSVSSAILGWLVIAHDNLSTEVITFILLQIAYGFFLCIPSLVVIEIFYKIISNSKRTNLFVLLSTMILSLIATNLTYYLFFKTGNLESYFFVFSITYSICLIFGFFFIFKSKSSKL